MLPFEPSLTTKLQRSLIYDLLQSLLSATFAYFTTKYQALQYAPYILQDILEATSSH